jgi:hypothetical protein
MTPNQALRHAYWLGVKMAYDQQTGDSKPLEEISSPMPYEDSSEPPTDVVTTEKLTTSLQQIPDPQTPDNHNPNEDRDPLTSYGRSTQHWDLDDMARFGLDIQGPSATGV